MFLSSFSYKERKWELSGFSPTSPLCLLVGRNSAGKTRTIRALQNVVSFIQMRQFVSLSSSNSFTASLTFSIETDKSYVMQYSLAVMEGIVEKEHLSVNSEVFIDRTSDAARYKSDTISPPPDKLVVQVRRDKELYPEIEQLMTWAEGVISVSCSDINPYTIISPTHIINPFSFSDLVDSLDENEKKSVMESASMLGYLVTSLKTIKFNDSVKLVRVTEKQVDENILDMQLSSGMLRTLYLLCFMQYVKNSTKVSLLLIDDMSEGLDYSRSTQLGRMVFEDCLQSNLQVIASSNDAFLMDVVDIANWQVIRRKGSKVSSISQQTHPELFRKFKMTGLSNFDFFSSDFIDKFLSAE